MRRRLFNLAAAVSLVLCVATAVLWVRGRLTWKHDRVTFNSGLATKAARCRYARVSGS